MDENNNVNPALDELLEEAIAQGGADGDDTNTDEGETDDTSATETDPAGQETKTTEDDDSTNSLDEGTVPEGTETKPNDNRQNVQDSPANQAFAQMRAENTQFRRNQQRIAKANGFDNVEDYLADLDRKEQEAIAKEQGISPAVAKRLADLEEGERARQEALHQQQFEHRMRTFQSEAGLTDDQIREFVTHCVRQNIHLPSIEIPYSVLYNGMFHDTMQKQAIEQARQDWIIKDQETANSASTPAGKGTTDLGGATMESFADFDKFLANTDIK